VAACACAASGSSSADGGQDSSGGFPDCAWDWEWVELGRLDWVEAPSIHQEMTVVAWSDSRLELISPEGTLEVTWPPTEAHSIVTAAEGETVVVDLLRCAPTDWATYVKVADTDGRLWWVGGGLADGSCLPEHPRLEYSDVPTGETCEDAPGIVVTPMSIRVNGDQTVTVAPGETVEVTISQYAYVAHAVTSQEWLAQPGDAEGPTHTASAYLTRLE